MKEKESESSELERYFDSHKFCGHCSRTGDRPLGYVPPTTATQIFATKN